MKQASRNTACSLAAALLVGGLAGQASAADRRPMGSQPVVVATDPAQPSPLDRIMATRREFHTIVVDTGLASADVTELVDRSSHFAEIVSRVMLGNPEQLHGIPLQELVARKMGPVFAEKGLDDATITHLTALVLTWTNQQIELEVQAPTSGVVAPSLEGSTR